MSAANHHETINELKDIIAAHPDFQKNPDGKITRG
jgi:hypothetical protein